MLAKSSEPFDSDEWIFEIKWDGFRSLAVRGSDTFLLPSRRENEQINRFPELRSLEALPAGTILDGEIVALTDGKPDFELLLARDGMFGRKRVTEAAQRTPVSFVAFDILYDRHEDVMELPLVERRERLQALINEVQPPLLVFSDGIVGHGSLFYEQACEQELEGVMAKRLGSQYVPGKRSDSWLKIKRVQRVHCLVIGWTNSESTDSFRSLVLASDIDGKLAYCGKVGSGFPGGLREQLEELMAARARDEPLVPCDEEANWLEPGIYCTVSFVDRTSTGMLRAPRFDELLVEDE